MKNYMKSTIALVVLMLSAASAWAQGIFDTTIMLDGARPTVAPGTVEPQIANGVATLTVTASDGYYIEASDITVIKTISGEYAQGRHRAGGNNIADPITLTPSGTVNPTGETVYTFTVTDEKYDYEVTADFHALQDISTATVTLSETSYTYDGSAKQPAVSSVVLGQTTIASDSYSVSYENNVDAADATDDTPPTVKVTATKIPYTGEAKATFTIAAATMTVTATGYSAAYDGQAHGISVTAPEGATIKYGESATSCTLDASPTYTNAGTYTVYYEVTKVNYGTVTGSATVTISEAAGSISYATASVSKTFGDAAFTNALTKTGDGSVTYSSDNTAVATVDATSGQVTIVGAGSATITATVADGTNYSYATKTASYTLTVAAATMTVTATGYSAAYDGQAHGISVTAPEGATIKYGESATSCTLDASPTYTNAGTYTVYYEVTKANYGTVTGSATVTISKAAGSISYATASVSKTFGDAAFTNALTKTGDGSVTYSSGNTVVATVDATSGQVTIVGAGSATITATVADGTNYSYATKTASYTLSVAAATMTVTSEGCKVVYDGKEHSISLAGVPEDAEVRYGEGAAIYQSNDNPTYVNAGKYVVYYRVEMPNYIPVEGSETVEIEKAYPKLILNVPESPMRLNKGDVLLFNVETEPEGLPVVSSSLNEAVAIVEALDDKESTFRVISRSPGSADIVATFKGNTNYKYAFESFQVIVEGDAIQPITENQQYTFDNSDDYINPDGSDKPLNGVVIDNILHNITVDEANGYDSEEGCIAIGTPTSPENILRAIEGFANFYGGNIQHPIDPAKPYYHALLAWLKEWRGLALFIDAPGEGEEGELTVESKEEGACQMAVRIGARETKMFQHDERQKDLLNVTTEDGKIWKERGNLDRTELGIPVVICNSVTGDLARTKAIHKGKKSGINVKVYSVTYKVKSTSGIDSVGRETKILSADGWYDLRGQRISQPQQKGIYINNGRKIVIK